MAPCNLYTGCMPWNPLEHIRAHAVPHQAREEEEDKSELERDQQQDILVDVRYFCGGMNGKWG